MENASKALIIAGAILISIVLVSVGVIVVNSLNIDDATSKMDQQAKDTFNSSFVNSSGENIRGTVVKTLLSNVISNNASNEGEESKTIYVKVENITLNSGTTVDSTKGTSEANTISAIRNKINTQHRYTVDIAYDGADKGLVHTITIKDNNSTAK